MQKAKDEQPAPAAPEAGKEQRKGLGIRLIPVGDLTSPWSPTTPPSTSPPACLHRLRFPSLPCSRFPASHAAGGKL
jgi:hypothetical protein